MTILECFYEYSSICLLVLNISVECRAWSRLVGLEVMGQYVVAVLIHSGDVWLKK